MPEPRSGWRVPLAAGGFLLGAVVASVGLGLAVPHLRKEGVGAVGLVGVALLAIGILPAARSALDQGGVLARVGYGVLLVDARGHGESEGRGMDLGWWGERDAAAAVDFVLAQPGLTYAVAGLLTAAPEPAPLRDSVVAAAERGTSFLVLATGDVETERLAAERLERAAPEVVEVCTIPGAGHVQGLRTASDEWARRVVGFLDVALAADR